MSDYKTERRTAGELQRIARYQRWVIATVLAQLAVWVGWALMSGVSPLSGGSDFALVLTVALGSAGGAYAFLIYWTIRDPLTAVMLGLASAVPLLGILALAVVNGAATRVLNENGVAVGLFGANGDTIEPEFAWIDEDADW